ncbi:unnamed protein product [Bursaphelenchus xylophilus]|uniref:Sodium/hydrogen exchanger n=1 Tax=Bursaphelenchus xylophilus TaxID=6326 RepID=A0A1I7S546_BURXY|nr:unnamed protein product [Bursaphelenchus xylophilus]CAG9117694.1 unnamed protein product [Bursaphelenchus xylophilus]
MFKWLLLASALSVVMADGNSSSPIIGWNFGYVEYPLIGSSWLLLAGIAKIVFHVNKRFGETFPDSGLLIVVGICLGLLLKLTSVSEQMYSMDSQIFFLYLLPPIILEAGYFMPSRALFDNFVPIMTFAVFGTIFNAITIGGSLALISATTSWFSIDISMIEAFLFSSLISAVDPVAVIAVFEEIQINEFLFVNVFAESLFNDAIAAVIFRMFNRLSVAGSGGLGPQDFVVFGASFFTMALGGTLIGVVSALLCAVLTKYTQRVKVIGAVFVFVVPYLGYLVAEMFEFSSILAICWCGIVMKQYIKCNITHDAASSVKYFVKMLAQSSEIVVFMFLGLSAISSESEWDYGFIGITLAATLIFRTIGVVIQCAFLNRYLHKKFSFEDQFVMAYGGLRGAIAFGLLSSIPSTVDAEKKAVFTSTTITVICFTVFFQGATIRPLLNWLKVERQKIEAATMVENVYNKYFDFAMAGVEEITGQRGSHSVRDWFERMNAQYLKPYLTKQRERKVFDATQIVRAYQKIALRETMEHVSIDRKKKGHSEPETHMFLTNMRQKVDKADLEEFLKSPENAAAVYAMFSPLIDNQIKEFIISQRQLPHSVTGDIIDDIKDDVLSEHQIPRNRKHSSTSGSANELEIEV